MVGKIARSVIQMAVSVYVVRYLGPGNYGLLSYSLSFVTLFSFLSNLGADQSIVVKHLASQNEDKDKILGTAFRLKFCGAGMVLAILAIVTQWMQMDDLAKSMILLISCMFFFQSFNVIDAYFQSQVHSKYVALVEFSQCFLSSLVKIYLIHLNAHVIWFAFIYILDFLFIALGLVIFYRKKELSIRQWNFDVQLAKKLLKESLPLQCTLLLTSIYMRFDQIIIKSIFDNQTVGYYALAVNLCELWIFIPMAINSSVFPVLINLKKTDENKYYADLQKFYDSMVLLAILIIIFMSIFGKFLVSFFFGQFMPAVPILNVYIWTNLFAVLGLASAGWYVIEDLQRYTLYRTLGGAVINIVLNIVLIRKLGVIGAAYAAVASYAVSTYFSLFFLPKCQKNLAILSNSFNLVSLFKRNFLGFFRQKGLHNFFV